GAVNPADGSGGLTPAQITRRAQIIAETGAPARIEAMIAERVADGVAALADAPIREEARAALIDLAVRATHRPA
ncbi:MAG: polyprenyl synthetase family protein, partial [Actinoplanes sp.]